MKDKIKSQEIREDQSYIRWENEARMQHMKTHEHYDPKFKCWCHSSDLHILW